MLYLGRGALYPVALEGALKLKELSYIHAEGYASGELKHGPIALIDRNVPVVVANLWWPWTTLTRPMRWTRHWRPCAPWPNSVAASSGVYSVAAMTAMPASAR